MFRKENTYRYQLKKREYFLCMAAALCGALLVCGPGLSAAVTAAAVFILLVMAVTDIKYMVIPDQWVLLLGAAAVISLLPEACICEVSITQRVIGIFAVSTPMALMNLVFSACGQGEGICFGGGDIKLTAVCGFLLGWGRLAAAMMLAFMAAGAFAAVLLIISRIKRKNRKRFIAFGPYISISVSLCILFPNWRLWGIMHFG